MTEQVQNPEQTGTGVATPESQNAAENVQPNAAAQEQANPNPLYVTKDDLSKFGDMLVSRMKQSDRDRSARIEKELTALKATITAANVQVTPQQEQAMREQIANQIDTATNSQEPDGQINQPDSADAFVANFLNDIFSATGTAVTKNDPEWTELQKVLDATWNDPKGAAKVSAAAVKASEAKRQRSANNQETAAARVSGGGGASIGQPQITDAPASKLWSEAYKK